MNALFRNVFSSQKLQILRTCVAKKPTRSLAQCVLLFNIFKISLKLPCDYVIHNHMKLESKFSEKEKKLQMFQASLKGDTEGRDLVFLREGSDRYHGCESNSSL